MPSITRKSRSKRGAPQPYSSTRFVPERYVILKDYSEVWACQPGMGDLIFEGTRYKKMCEYPYPAEAGQEVVGYVMKENISFGAPYNYHFVRIAEPLLTNVNMKGFFYHQRWLQLKERRWINCERSKV